MRSSWGSVPLYSSKNTNPPATTMREIKCILSHCCMISSRKPARTIYRHDGQRSELERENLCGWEPGVALANPCDGQEEHGPRNATQTSNNHNHRGQASERPCRKPTTQLHSSTANCRTCNQTRTASGSNFPFRRYPISQTRRQRACRKFHSKAISYSDSLCTRWPVNTQ